MFLRQSIEIDSLAFAPHSTQQASQQLADLWGSLACLESLQEATLDLAFRLKSSFLVDLEPIAAVTQLMSAIS